MPTYINMMVVRGRCRSFSSSSSPFSLANKSAKQHSTPASKSGARFLCQRGTAPQAFVSYIDSSHKMSISQLLRSIKISKKIIGNPPLPCQLLFVHLNFPFATQCALPNAVEIGTIFHKVLSVYVVIKIRCERRFLITMLNGECLGTSVNTEELELLTRHVRVFTGVHHSCFR